jgi:hypothetical protein
MSLKIKLTSIILMSERRSAFDTCMLSLISTVGDSIGIWTGWFSNTIDNYDAQPG